MKLAAIATSTIVFGVCLFFSACGQSSTTRAFQSPKEAKDQAAALQLAEKVDLPLLEMADSMVIETEAWAGSKKLVVTDSKALSRIRAALAPSKTPPSGGATWCTLSWRRGDEQLRKVWCYDYGEWGFERPSVNWTTGLNPKLPEIVRELLAK